MTPETIEKLKASKSSAEEAAFLNGETQARTLINEEADYEFLCELADQAKEWKNGSDERWNLEYIDLGYLPSALNFFVIDGFFTTILQIHNEFRASCKTPSTDSDSNVELTAEEIGHAVAIDAFKKSLIDSTAGQTPIPYDVAAAAMNAFDYCSCSFREVVRLADCNIEALEAKILQLTNEMGGRP